ncbi:MAG: ribosomal-processing cysteine protease Prp [Bacilli bacterium]
MIKVSLKKDNNNIKEINITGHAEYSEIGKDIVCSAVSSIVITTVNGILGIDKDSIEYNENSNKIKIVIVKNDSITSKLILNMISLLKELGDDYPNNIKFI